MNIITYLLEKGYAKAERHASNYIAKIELDELSNSGGSDAEIMARIELYEAWKRYMPDKDEREHCAMMAIAGIEVPKPAVEMFPAETVSEQNPFGKFEVEEEQPSSVDSDDGLRDCKHGIPLVFCSECVADLADRK